MMAAKVEIQGSQMTIQIGNRKVGDGSPVLIVAEVAQAHDGSLGMAHAYIDAVAASGADAVKFQTHIAAEESTPNEPWRIKFSRQDASRFDYWKRMEFSELQWRELKKHAEEKGLIFLSSPFSALAVDLLADIGMPAWKVGAGEVTTPDILDRIIRTGKPVLLSNGMSTWKELDRTILLIKKHNVPFGVYQCTTAYPCPPEKIGLNVLAELRKRYNCPVGLSDHSGTIHAGLAAATLGANMLEVHVTFSKQSFGPDVPASLTMDELSQLVGGVRFIEKALANPVDKDAMAKSLSSLRDTFRKQIVAKTPLAAGQVLNASNIAYKKSSGGIPADETSRVFGRKLTTDKQADDVIQEKDLE